jgi:hypothetical protein
MTEARSTAVLTETITEGDPNARSTAVLIEVIASVTPAGGGILLVGF